MMRNEKIVEALNRRLDEPHARTLVGIAAALRERQVNTSPSTPNTSQRA
jgi:hypothetical protein